MCGIVALLSHNAVNQDIYDALTALQHRGQDAAGMMTCAQGQLFLRKSNGLVRDVFHTRHMLRLRGNMGLGHVRYPTAGTSSFAEAQPLYVNSPYGISLAHNGNLTNSRQLAADLFRSDRRHLNTNSDSEVLLNILASEIQKLHQEKLLPVNIFTAISKLYQRCQGAYAAVAMITDQGILGFRDPHGIRPLVYGRRQHAQGIDYMFASESAALDVLGFSDIVDVLPGEAIFIDQQGQLHRQQCASQAQLNPCIFEYVYLARPDSIIDGISVYKVRLSMGKYLAARIKRDFAKLPIDAVIPIPDTSRPMAMSLAESIGKKFREGFIKNRYIGRTFIMPGQAIRQKSVRHKLNPITAEFKDRNVLLVDDSIVRGTTCKQIIQMARRAGAKQVYFASAAPPIRYANVYGIDMPSRRELIAHDRTEQQIAATIGADVLLYQKLDDLIAAAQRGNPKIEKFETSIFTGDYVTKEVNTDLLGRLDQERNDVAKQVRIENNDSELDLPGY